MPLSIIIPVLNEIQVVEQCLRRLSDLRKRGAEIIVVDGESQDGTSVAAGPLADLVLAAPRGRALQMNAGAIASSGDVLVFLHVDTKLPPDADTLIQSALATSGRVWGRFDVRIEPSSPVLAVVARMMILRSRLSGIATGDQAIFVRRSTFLEIGGYPEIPLMEDIALSRTLKRISWPACLPERVTTSARRWQTHGVLGTILLMWRLRLAYFLGADPATLARQYGYGP
ncbi:MAG: TIGR04283 family arsenosugar biosynthesis glycosyltransferase [Alphaproteobacteria bacterium]|nr:TIGR04283 family arsenosugar biosynthesis glycosyltransferase [Alphaproteobacteria bacterium]